MSNRDSGIVEELDRENKELKAKLVESNRESTMYKCMTEALKLAIESVAVSDQANSGFEPSLSVFQRDIYELIELGNITPSQSLDVIKADAVLEFVSETGISDIKLSDVKYKLGNITEIANDYADKLRGKS